MSAKTHNAHERPPANNKRQSVIGENLLTVVTIIGVIGNHLNCQKLKNSLKSLFL